MIRFGLIVSIVCLPLVVLAQVSTSTASSTINPEDLEAVIGFLVLAFRKQQWRLFAGFALLAFVGGVRKFKLIQRLPPNRIPLGVMGLAMATSAGLGLIATPPIPDHVIAYTAVSIGLTAIGGFEFWDRVLKPLPGELMGLAKKIVTWWRNRRG